MPRRRDGRDELDIAGKVGAGGERLEQVPLVHLVQDRLGYVQQ